VYSTPKVYTVEGPAHFDYHKNLHTTFLPFSLSPLLLQLRKAFIKPCGITFHTDGDDDDGAMHTYFHI